MADMQCSRGLYGGSGEAFLEEEGRKYLFKRKAVRFFDSFLSR